MSNMVGLRFHPPQGQPKMLTFLSVCQFVCLFVTLLNVRDCAPNFAMKALEYRYDFDAVVVVHPIQLSQTAANWRHH